MSRLDRRLTVSVIGHGLLALSSAIMVGPFLWMIVQSFLSTDGFTFSNYIEAVTRVPFLQFLLNGLLVSLTVLVLQLIIAAPCAYALAKLTFPMRSMLFGCVLITLLIPPELLALPLFLAFGALGLLDTYAALVIPFVISPFAIFLLRQFFKTVPNEMIDAARLDGMSELSIVWRLMVPMAMPAIAAFSILSIISRWNGLYWPSIAVKSIELMPPSTGIVLFSSEETGTDIGPLMAAACLVVAPLLVAFFLAQKRIIDGMTLGAKP